MKRIVAIVFVACLATVLAEPPHTGVINSLTGVLLRSGYVSTNDWLADGSFDPATESVVSGIPRRAYTFDDPATNMWHSFSNGGWSTVEGG